MNFDIADFVSKLIIYMVVWIFSVSFHEFGHAWVSYKFGDDTAYRLGRVTLNPIPHIDPIGTLLLPFIGFVISFTSAGNFPLIAWGKPTPVNPLKWRNKDTANVCVSLAGIVINLLIAVVASGAIKINGFAGNYYLSETQNSALISIFVKFLLSTDFYERRFGDFQSSAVSAARRKQGFTDISAALVSSRSF